MLRALFVTRGTQIVSCGMRLSVADFFLYNILVVEKARIRRIIEAEGIPYTYLCCHAFTGHNGQFIQEFFYNIYLYLSDIGVFQAKSITCSICVILGFSYILLSSKSQVPFVLKML